MGTIIFLPSLASPQGLDLSGRSGVRMSWAMLCCIVYESFKLIVHYAELQRKGYRLPTNLTHPPHPRLPSGYGSVQSV